MNTELSEEMQKKVEKSIAEDVAKRMEGLKKFTLNSRETVYYARTVWAKDEDDAREIADNEGDWGEPVDYDDFEVYEVYEEQ